MNYKAISIILLIFSMAVSALYFAAVDTAKNLIEINSNLLLAAEELSKHPVHDAEITVWKRNDGKLLIVVNGEFGHLIGDPCGRAL